jgi:hypothetical protein
MRDERFNKLPTLCWDCANATSNDCPWVDRAEPVPGWGAKETKIRKGGKVVCESYHIRSCPKFKRDAEYGGRKKYVSQLEYVAEKPLKGEKDEKCNSDKHSRPDAWDRVAEPDDPRPVGVRSGGVADKRSGESWGALNHVERDPFDLALAIIERYVLDWRALEYGDRDFVLVDGVLVSKEDTLTFFFEPWFYDLCTAIHYTPTQIRKALRIPEDAIERLLIETFGEEAARDRQRDSGRDESKG